MWFPSGGDTNARPAHPIELPIHEVVLHPGRRHDLPPLDLAQDGDRQAIIVGHPIGAPIDSFLRRVPSLRVLLSRYRFRVESPQPQIEAVHCEQELDQPSIRNLPGLKAVGSWLGGERNIDLEWFSSSLEHLGGSDRQFKDFGGVTRFALQSLRLTADDAQSWRLVSRLTSLRRIRFDGVPIRAGAVLQRLVNVEEAEILNLAVKDLKALRGWTRLRRLQAPPPRSMEGVEALTALEDLWFEGRTCPPMAALAALPRLQHLVLRCGRGPLDLEAISRLSGLRSLTIDIDSFPIPSAQPFLSLTQLETLDLGRQRIADGQVSQFGALRNLKTLKLGWAYQQDEVAKLRDALPECVVDVDVQEGAPPEPRRRGFVEYDQNEGEATWSIFQNLCGRLEADDNHEAERIVKAALKKTAPDLARRILFDSERDAFCAVAKTEADVLTVADLIIELAGNRP